MSTRTAMNFVVLSACAAASCRHRPPPPTPIAQETTVQADLSEFRRAWLAPARIAPPTIEFAARISEEGGLSVAATPARPEDAPWNEWTGPEARLFNDRVGLMFHVRFATDGPVRWVPESTAIFLNQSDEGLPPAPTPDLVLTPLLGAALAQERGMVDADLVERTRAAGPFRAAYLPTDVRTGIVEGVVIFPLPEAEIQVVSVDLSLGIATADQVHQVRLSWD